MKPILLLPLSWLLFLAQLSPGQAQQQVDFSLPSPQIQDERKLQLWATYYYLFPAKSVTTGGIPFRDRNGDAISDPVSPKDWCLGAIEGSVRVNKDGKPKTINIDGTSSGFEVNCAQVLSINPSQKPWIRATGRSRFTLANGAWGDGVNNFRLVPYRSAAVDRKKIPYGSVIFIPSLTGKSLQLTDDQAIVHDGFLFAADTGSAIIGNHIDVFCGAILTNCMPSIVKGNANQTFEAWIVNSPELTTKLRKLHQ